MPSMPEPFLHVRPHMLSGVSHAAVTVVCHVCAAGCGRSDPMSCCPVGLWTLCVAWCGVVWWWVPCGVGYRACVPECVVWWEAPLCRVLMGDAACMCSCCCLGSTGTATPQWRCGASCAVAHAVRFGGGVCGAGCEGAQFAREPKLTPVCMRGSAGASAALRVGTGATLLEQREWALVEDRWAQCASLRRCCAVPGVLTSR
jgi:hypothetical protein